MKKRKDLLEINDNKIKELKFELINLDDSNLIKMNEDLDKEIRIKELEFKNELELSAKLVKEKEIEKLELDNEITLIKNNIDEMNKSIQQSKINIDVIINKKNSLISQLKKSIQEKITDIIRSRNTSPYIQRLVESQEKHCIEKQKLIEEYNKIKHEHEIISENVRNKAIILDEIVSYIKESKRIPTNNPLTNLNNLYNYAQKKNKSLARAIFVLEKEINK